MEDYRRLTHFLNTAALSFGCFSQEAGTELAELAQKFESGEAGFSDKELALKVLQNAKQHFISSPKSEKRDYGLLSVGLLIAQLELEINGWSKLKD